MLGSDCTVKTAANVKEALEQIGLFEFDAVVADLELGDDAHDGAWLLDQVRQRQPTAKCLLMSGHHEPLAQMSRDNNELIALPKPFTSEDLLAAVAG